MVTRLIKTEEDYHLALNRIEELMDSEENPQRDDELELLAALVEMYEDKEYPIDPTLLVSIIPSKSPILFSVTIFNANKRSRG